MRTTKKAASSAVFCGILAFGGLIGFPGASTALADPVGPITGGNCSGGVTGEAQGSDQAEDLGENIGQGNSGAGSDSTVDGAGGGGTPNNITGGIANPVITATNTMTSGTTNGGTGCNVTVTIDHLPTGVEVRRNLPATRQTLIRALGTHDRPDFTDGSTIKVHLIVRDLGF